MGIAGNRQNYSVAPILMVAFGDHRVTVDAEVVERAHGSGNIGYVRGIYMLTFEFNQNTYSNRGKYLHILERFPDRGWRISHHFWNDLPADQRH